MAGNSFYQQYQNDASMPNTQYQPRGQMMYQNNYDNFSSQQTYNRPQLPSNNSQSQAQNNFNGIMGRVVNAVEEITPNEVPMDGSISLFPTSNYREIYAKQWGTNGLINTVKYVPDTSQQSKEAEQQDFNALILERLDSIEKKLNFKPYRKPYDKSRNKQNDNSSKETSE